MLSEKTLKGISQFLRHACYLKIIPFDWNSKTPRLSVISDPRIYIIYAIFVYMLINFIYLVVSFYFLMDSMGISTKSFHVVWIVSYFNAFTIDFGNLKLRQQIATFANHFFSHQRGM